MPVIVTAESEMGKELAKWEQHQTAIIAGSWAPGNPHKYRPYPRMLYLANRLPDGKVACLQAEPEPLAYPTAEQHDRACRSVDVFNRKCMVLVQDESEEQRYLEMGWRRTVEEAMAHHSERETRNLQAAAERAFKDSKMGEKAQREAAAAEKAHEGYDHLEEVPEKPLSRGQKAAATRAANKAKLVSA